MQVAFRPAVSIYPQASSRLNQNKDLSFKAGMSEEAVKIVEQLRERKDFKLIRSFLFEEETKEREIEKARKETECEADCLKAEEAFKVGSIYSSTKLM
jgi:hypothetical protein